MNRTLCLTIAAALSLGATAATAQSWTYKSYKKSGQGGQYDRNRFVEGTLTLEQKDGKYSMRMMAGATDACFSGNVPALVEKTDATTTIEPQLIAGCEKQRYVIANDGSGGHRELWRGEKWVDTKWDHGLVPAKN